MSEANPSAFDPVADGPLPGLALLSGFLFSNREQCLYNQCRRRKYLNMPTPSRIMISQSRG